MGMSPEKAIYACTYTPAARMRMYDRGVIAPGKLADFLLISELESFHIQEVYKEGTKVYDETIPYVQEESSQAFPSSFYESVNLNKLGEDAFQVKLMKNDGKVKCRIMNVKNGSTFTEEKHDDLNIEAGMLQWEESEYGLLATFERYGKNGNSARGLIGGDVLKRGAVATTYSHDNHNLLVLGQNKEDMVIAANEVIKQQGGICCVHNGEILANVPLPVGGILSEEPLSIISKQVEQLTATLQALGYEHYNAIMSLSTLSLPVSPALKITDHGLIDVNKGMVVPLVVK